MSLFARLGRFADRRRWWVVAGWAVLLLLALPFAPRAGGALQAGGFSSDTPAVGPGAASPRVASSASRRRPWPSCSTATTLRAGDPAFEAAAAAAIADVATAPHVVRVIPHTLAPRQVSADRTTAYDVVLLDFPPDDSPKSDPDRRAAPPPSRRDRRRTGRRTRVLRRRPGGVGIGPAPIRADLAAAGGDRAGLRLRVPGRVGRTAGGRRRRRRGGTRGDLRDREPDADEHLRAESRDAARPRAGRGLLAPDDQPVPRGARSAPHAAAGRATCRRRSCEPRFRARWRRRSRPPVGPSSSAG